MIEWRSLRRATSSCAAALSFCWASAAGAEDWVPPVELEPLIAEARLNGERLPEPVIFLKDKAGGLYASDALLRRWRLRLPAAAEIRFEGETYRSIHGLADLRTTFEEREQAVAIEASPSLFERQRLALADVSLPPMTDSANGAFVNYDLFLERTGGRSGIHGLADLNLFTAFGTGTGSFVGRYGSGKRQLLRLETSWTIDRPEGMTSIRIGDGITRGASGGAPLRFAGVQFARNFAVQPGFVTLPLPTLTGSAALPSVAEVYVNNVLQGSSEVKPGPFEFRQAPVQAGGGTIELVTQDMLGRQIVITENYYSSSEMLREGLHDFSYEAGFLREDFGLRSNRYGAFIVSGVHRYGITDDFTGEAGAQLTRSHQSAGAALTATLFDLALVSAGASFSRSSEGEGGAALLRLERRSRTVSFGARVELRSELYRAVGEPSGRRTRLTAFAFADHAFRGGSAGFNYYRREDRDGEGEELIGGFASLAVGGGTLQLSARRAVSGRSANLFAASFALPLGQMRSAAASLDVGNGRPLTRLSIQQNLPAGTGGGYRAAVEAGDGEAFQAEYRWQGPAASWSMEVAGGRGTSGMRLSMAGAVGLIGDSAFVSRRLNSSFAEVRVDGRPGVRVYADNQLVGTTGEDGRLIVPNLRAYEANPIRIDHADLPLDAQLESFDAVVRPYARSGVAVRFSPRNARGVILRVRLANGEPLPAGAMATVEGRPEGHVVANGGEIYVEGLSGTVRIRARWQSRTCVFDVRIPENDDPQPFLDGLLCRDEHYAAL